MSIGKSHDLDKLFLMLSHHYHAFRFKLKRDFNLKHSSIDNSLYFVNLELEISAACNNACLSTLMTA